MANKQATFFGHPMGLSTLFATEMWERFSYYGMRALLVLFLVAGIDAGGFGLSQEEAFTIYGIFTFLVYVTPLIGGVMADKVLGQRATIYIGGLAMAIGQFILAFAAMSGDNMEARQLLFYSGLGVLILGNGFFKPNISTMVGQLYDDNDPRKDGGFTIFYMGINLGAFIAPLVAGFLGENVAWQYGYLSAGIGMLIGVTWFICRSEGTLGHIGMPPQTEEGRTHLLMSDWMKVAGFTVALVLAPLAFMSGWGVISSMVQNIIIWVVGIAGGGYLVTSIVRGTENADQWKRVAVILILAFFNIFFWVGFEQAGTTFNMFALENTNRMVFGFEIPASWFQSINAIFIVVLAPIFSLLWVALGKVKLNPKTPFKFAWGMCLLSVGAAIMAVADSLSNGGSEIVKVSPLWLTAVYLIFTLGELCISPIGLSMITKLSPQKLTSTLMGVWMFSFAAGNFGASQAQKLSSAVEVAIGQPVNVFWFVSAITAIATLCLFLLGPWLSKMMKGIN
ncbi:MAG: peptide MFS transporter [Rikenellaceae bacterium]